MGIGIAKHAKNIKEATMVLEYLSSTEVQGPVIAAFSQYPANPAAAMSSTLVDFGTFKQDEAKVGDISKSVNVGRELAKKALYK
jgi:iron(III) transport system substrate-binding protein